MAYLPHCNPSNKKPGQSEEQDLLQVEAVQGQRDGRAVGWE